MKQIVMIFPGGLRPECEQELGTDIVFYRASLDEAVSIALKLEKTGVRVIISRGGTADAIRQAVEIPVVSCEATSLDLIDTLLEIKQEVGPRLRKVALINYYNVSYDAKKLGSLLDLKIQQLFWTNSEELIDHVRQVRNDAIDVVLGAQITVRLAEEFGIKGFLIQVGSETIRQAVQKAKEILEIRHKDLAQSERIRSLLNFAHEGIISVDGNGFIDLANPLAGKILQKTDVELIGKQAKTIFPGWDALDSHEPQLRRVAKINDKHIVYNRVPLIVDNKNIGSVFTFIDSADVVEAEQKIRALLHAKGLIPKYSLSDIVGKSPAISEAIKKTKLYARTDSTVLITGETGTGKELFVHSLHVLSKRHNRAFVAINCAAVPENLLESELYGYEEGAFTGARKGGRVGLFELAHRGTLFLDEISEMPISLQSRLLRAIQEKEVMRLGGDRVIPIDVRIVASTNRDLIQAVRKGDFRRDLYFRLNILHLEIPPLRDHVEDIPLLLAHFCDYFARQFAHEVPPLPHKITERLKTYRWPGNVRELETIVHRYAILVRNLDDPTLLEALFEDSDETYAGMVSGDEGCIKVQLGPISEMLDCIYRKAFDLVGENKTRAADLLGVNRMTVSRRLSHYGEESKLPRIV